MQISNLSTFPRQLDYTIQTLVLVLIKKSDWLSRVPILAERIAETEFSINAPDQ